ncbi:MAG: hypothetical protein QHJ73_08190 [Armatimonadota bacterium]|nr:hypothetical protein [Armatimonadota bacterium]
MKYLAVTLVTALLALQAALYAAPLTPLPPSAAAREVGAVAEGPRLSVGLAATSWGREDYDETVDTLGVTFDSKVRPLVTAEYQLTPKWSVGGWYNPVAWDMVLRWDMPGGPVQGAVASFEGTGSMFELHGTMSLGNDFAVQAGVLHFNVDWEYQPGGQLDLSARNLEDKATKIVLWGVKTFRMGAVENPPFALTVAAGLAQGLVGDYDSKFNPTTGAPAKVKTLTVNGLLGASYSFTPRWSADASLWLADFNKEEERSVRLTAGVTGRF